MSFRKIDILYGLLIFIIAIFFTFDTFTNSGRLATMDGEVHATNIEQYTIALSQGDFPVVWMDGYANYGMPMGLIAQPLPNYIGAGVNFLVHNPETAYNILGFIGVFFSGLFFYFFLRLYFKPEASFVGTFLFTFSSFRIMDLYIRGDLPEILASVFLPILLISFHQVFHSKKIMWYFVMSLAFAAIALTHPMMLVIFSFLMVPYILFLMIVTAGKLSIHSIISVNTIKRLIGIALSGVAGLGLAGFYIIPLYLEIKYFVQGQYTHFLSPQFLLLSDFFKYNWYYFTPQEIFTRGHIVVPGEIELLGVILGVGSVVIERVVMKSRKKITLLDFAVFVSLVVLFFVTQYSKVFYDHISFLDKILFPWRMLAVFIFLPPIIFAWMFEKLQKNILIILFILLIAFIRFPQIYGKNYTVYTQSHYIKTEHNLYSVVLNTLWMGKAEEYPVKQIKGQIIDGNGVIKNAVAKNSSRKYVIDASTNVRLVDYTFYFPGWNVYVDGQKTPIQFQDPNYRGMITYTVPAGKHTVLVIFQDTVIRKLGKIISVCFGIVLIAIFLLRNRLRKFIL